MRKLIVWFLLLIFVLALAGCHRQDEIAWKSYRYEKEGAGGDSFAITIQEDGRSPY